MSYTKEQYVELPVIRMPIVLGSGLTLDELKGHCPDCGRDLASLRGKIVEYAYCSDVKFAGLCHPCKLLVTCHFRYYKDGRVMQNGRDGWVEMETDKESVFDIVVKKIRRLFR